MAASLVGRLAACRHLSDSMATPQRRGPVAPARERASPSASAASLIEHMSVYGAIRTIAARRERSVPGDVRAGQFAFVAGAGSAAGPVGLAAGGGAGWLSFCAAGSAGGA